jgi:hypothetical protein
LEPEVGETPVTVGAGDDAVVNVSVEDDELLPNPSAEVTR